MLAAMSKFRTILLAAALSACTSEDDAAKFVGSWTYDQGAAAHVDCGSGGSFDVPLDTVVETFAESGGKLVKTDSQGCTGLTFTAHAALASLAASGQSCTIPASGQNPSATFAPSAYTFAFANEKLTATVTATYTPQGAAAGCAVTGTNTLSRSH